MIRTGRRSVGWFVAVVGVAIALFASCIEAAVFFVHTDHLGTPLAVTNAGQQKVWATTNDAFGQANVTTNAITNNVRFPGQYFDVELGTHYNLNRDYDPQVGRYLQSDPIGLEGGINTYVYVKSNPLRYVDPEGLNVGVLGCAGGPVGCAIGVGLGILFGGSAISDMMSAIDGSSSAGAAGEACPTKDNPERCEINKAKARSVYRTLMGKRMPQYLSGGTNGSDEGHRQAITQLQVNLRKSTALVRLYCNPLPPELPEWERVANMPIPILY